MGFIVGFELGELVLGLYVGTIDGTILGNVVEFTATFIKKATTKNNNKTLDNFK